MKNKDEKFMRQTIALARKSVRTGGGPFAAVIVKDGKVIGQGMNRVTVWNDPSAHGEVVAIRDACKNLGVHQLKNCTIYTSCEPCPMCYATIYWARIGKIYFAAGNGDAAKAGFDDLAIDLDQIKGHARKKIAFRQILRRDALAAFDDWTKKKNKILY